MATVLHTERKSITVDHIIVLDNKHVYADSLVRASLRNETRKLILEQLQEDV